MNIFIRVINDYVKLIGKKKFFFICFIGIINSLFVAFEPFVFSQLLSYVEQYLRGEETQKMEIMYFLLFWGVFILFAISLRYYHRFYQVDQLVLKFYVQKSLKEGSEKALKITYGSYLSKKPGETFRRLEKGKAAFLNFGFFFFLTGIRNIFSLIFMLPMMFYMSIKMSFVVLLGIPVAFFIGTYFNGKTIQAQKEINNKEDELFGIIGDGLTNFSLLKSLTLEKRLSSAFSKSMDKLFKKQHSVSKRWAVSDIYVEAIVMIFRLLVLSLGTILIINNEIGLATLYFFFTIVGFIYYPLGYLLSEFRHIQEWQVSMEKYYEEFEDNIHLEDLESGKKIKNVKGNIEFKSINFSYDNDRKVLENINFSINAGKKIALVGNTGAGKSTITHLLLRLWDVKDGAILLDGQDIKTLNKSSLRKHIGIVSQENSLFNLSIEDNLKMAKADATKEEIQEALKNAEAHFALELKDGIKTIIGERGLKLSGGEKQRISIARLFLKNPEILILDEATSALDNKTEQKIAKALNRLMKGKTSIVIAHRLSTIKSVDEVLFLENGKILERGSYQGLIKQKGKFYQLANTDKLLG